MRYYFRFLRKKSKCVAMHVFGTKKGFHSKNAISQIADRVQLLSTKHIIYITVVVSALLSIFFFMLDFNSSKFAYAAEAVKISDSTKASLKTDSDELQATSEILFSINPIWGSVNTQEKLTLNNISSDCKLTIKSVSVKRNSGFESVELGNWTIKNKNTTYYSGACDNVKKIEVEMEPQASIDLTITTTLYGQNAINCANKYPLSFVFEYDVKYPPVLNYCVCVWGINQDGDNTVTFGPATGTTKDCLNVSCDNPHCIHNESWETIVNNLNNGHSDYYQQCLINNCTKEIPLSQNLELLGKYPDKDTTCSKLFYSITGCGKYLSEYYLTSYTNFNASMVEDDCESANWATCRLRTTLNGTDNTWETIYPSVYATTAKYKILEAIHPCCTKDNCLLSTFPEVLQQNIKVKTYEVPTTWLTREPNFDILSHTTVKDKLWLPSFLEIAGKDIDQHQIVDFGEQYQKLIKEGADWKTGTYKNYTITWDEKSNWISRGWYVRSPVRWFGASNGQVRNDGVFGYSSGFSETANEGISPFFVL